MADTQRILHHIAELYAKPKSNQNFDIAVYEMEEKMSARFDEYDKAFSEKITADVIKAIDDYWRYKNDKTRPTLAQLMAMENSDFEKASKQDNYVKDSDEDLKRRCIKCMWNMHDKFGLEGAQSYWRALLNTYGIPYPATEEIMRSL